MAVFNILPFFILINNPEIKALLQLIEDPDGEIFDVVSKQIKSFGKPIIPSLEHLWEIESNVAIQSRIEKLIHELYYDELLQEWLHWKSHSQDLLAGSLLTAKYLYPELVISNYEQAIEKIRKNIWLEINQYLTPIEKTNVISSMLFRHYNIQSSTIDMSNYDDFLLNKNLDSKKGNPFGLRILFLILAQKLDINIQAVDIPHQSFLAYYDDSIQLDNTPKNLLFYINPANGQLFSTKDVAHYLQRIQVPLSADIGRPMNNMEVITNLMTKLAECSFGEDTDYKNEDLLSLANQIISRSIS